MPEISVHPDFPNVVLLIDDALYDGGNLDRVGLQALLDTPPDGSPIGNGTHDFFVFHARPNSPGGGVFWAGSVDHSAAPQKRRGTIRMTNNLTSWNEAEVLAYLDTFNEEFGHYWLVRGGLTIDGQPLRKDEEFMQAALAGDAIPERTLLGRADAHWSAFLDSDGSSMDGQDWVEQEEIPLEGTVTEETKLRRYTHLDMDGPAVGVPELGELTTRNRYSDLELAIMGVIDSPAAYPDNDNSFDYVIPRWLVPRDFHAGLVVALAPDDLVMFGFHQDFRTLKVERTGTSFPETFDLSSFYEPWVLGRRMFLRVVRRGDTLHFQARPQWGSKGCLRGVLENMGWLGPLDEIEPFSETSPLSAPNADPTQWGQWNTLRTLDISGATPQGVGYIVKTWEDTPIVETSFSALQVQDASGERSVVSVESPMTGPDYLDALPSDALRFHRPKEGPVHLPGGDDVGRLIISPSIFADDGTFNHIGQHNHWTGVDEAPKLLTSIAADDFIVAGSVRVDRVIDVPWAGGQVADTTLWGHRRRVPMSTFGLNPNDATRREYPGPYKTAFVIVAPSAAEVTATMAENIDRIRQAAEANFSAATNGVREIDSSVP